MPLEKILVGCAETWPVAPRAFEYSKSDHRSDRLTPTSQLDLDARFGLIDDAREAAVSLSDGIPMGDVRDRTSKCSLM